MWVDMLSRMLRREVELVPDAVAKLLKDVLSRLGDKNSVILYVAPEDLELVQGRLDKEFEDLLRGVRHLELKADSNVDKGSCIVETRLGVYDARWRTQMGQIEATVEKLVQKLSKGSKKVTRPRKKKVEESAPPVEPTQASAEQANETSSPEKSPDATPEPADAPAEPVKKTTRRASKKKESVEAGDNS